MNRNQKIAVYNFLGYIATIISLIGIALISIGLAKAQSVKIQKKQVNVRGYNWGPYAFDLQSKLYQLGYSDNDTVIIINNCKKQEKLGKLKGGVGRCIKTAGMIGYTESSGWKRCYNNNCMGLYSGRKVYKDKDKMFKDWMSRYIKYWYNHHKPYEYYGAKPLTRYCTDGNIQALHNAEHAYKLLNSK